MTQEFFECPITARAGLEKVIAGEYDVELRRPPAVILDLGANCGAFAVWAHRKWPAAQITCYEPEVENLKLLMRNAGAFVDIHPGAVFCRGELWLHAGRNNCGEHSLIAREEQEAHGKVVGGISPRELPPCDLVKLDTEGAELTILSAYPHLGTTRAVVLEWHSRRDRAALRALLEYEQFTILQDGAWALQRGILKAVRE